MGCLQPLPVGWLQKRSAAEPVSCAPYARLRQTPAAQVHPQAALPGPLGPWQAVAGGPLALQSFWPLALERLPRGIPNELIQKVEMHIAHLLRAMQTTILLFPSHLSTRQHDAHHSMTHMTAAVDQRTRGSETSLGWQRWPCTPLRAARLTLPASYAPGVSAPRRVGAPL